MIPEENVVLIEEHVRPIITFSMALRSGILEDPPGLDGVATLTCQMLTRGAGTMNHAELAEALDMLGCSFSVGVGRDAIYVVGDTLTRNLESFESLVTQILCEPTFPEDELEKLKRQFLADIEQIRDSDALLARHFFVKDFYGPHPYGRSRKGTETSIPKITREHVLKFYRENFCYGDVLVGAAGDISPERLRSFAANTVGRLPNQVPQRSPLPALQWKQGHRVTLVDKPERSQTQIFVGHPTIDVNHPDFIALSVANTIFGGTFTARLSHEIREKRGWSYGAYSYIQSDQRLGTFFQRFYPSNDDAVPALRVAEELYKAFVQHGVTAEELNGAKNFLIHAHPLNLETAEDELHERLGGRIVGRPDDWLETYVPSIKALTLAQVNAAVSEHLNHAHTLTTILCTADMIKDAIGDWDRSHEVATVDYRKL